MQSKSFQDQVQSSLFMIYIKKKICALNYFSVCLYIYLYIYRSVNSDPAEELLALTEISK
jgi:hypothetical protein